MIRVFGLAIATLVLFYVVGFATMLLTGCTEPGSCTFAGELARDHGMTIAVGGALGVLALGLLARGHGNG